MDHHSPTIIDEYVHAVCLEIAPAHTRIRLTDLRKAITFVSPDVLDLSLKRLQKTRDIMLMSLEDRSEVTRADQIAAIDFSGSIRHLVYAK